MNDHLGRKINITSNIIKREVTNIDSILLSEEISGANGRILVYISKSDSPVYQKDIEKRFGITKATASSIITLMEKKELVERIKNDSDARLRQIVLTAKGVRYSNSIVEGIIKLENKIKEGFSDDEVELLNSYLERIINNLSKGDNHD